MFSKLRLQGVVSSCLQLQVLKTLWECVSWLQNRIQYVRTATCPTYRYTCMCIIVKLMQVCTQGHSSEIWALYIGSLWGPPHRLDLLFFLFLFQNSWRSGSHHYGRRKSEGLIKAPAKGYVFLFIIKSSVSLSVYAAITNFVKALFDLLW